MPSNLTSTEATVNITVNPIDDEPRTLADVYNVAEDGVLNIAAPGVLDNDLDVEPRVGD